MNSSLSVHKKVRRDLAFLAFVCCTTSPLENVVSNIYVWTTPKVNVS